MSTICEAKAKINFRAVLQSVAARTTLQKRPAKRVEQAPSFRNSVLGPFFYDLRPVGLLFAVKIMT